MTGDLNVACVLICHPALAERAAAGMFELEGAPTAEQTHDAGGEIVNIHAGNLNSEVGGVVRLSLPTVTTDLNGAPRALRSALLRHASFACEGFPIELRIVASTRADDGNEPSMTGAVLPMAGSPAFRRTSDRDESSLGDKERNTR